jgi:hypothetical protein
MWSITLFMRIRELRVTRGEMCLLPAGNGCGYPKKRTGDDEIQHQGSKRERQDASIVTNDLKSPAREPRAARHTALARPVA